MAQYPLPLPMLSQVCIITGLHTHQATIISETAISPNCIVDQPTERGLSIPGESQYQKNKDTLPAS
jgi:hypothetical protein